MHAMGVEEGSRCRAHCCTSESVPLRCLEEWVTKGDVHSTDRNSSKTMVRGQAGTHLHQNSKEERIDHGNSARRRGGLQDLGQHSSLLPLPLPLPGVDAELAWSTFSGSSASYRLTRKAEVERQQIGKLTDRDPDVTSAMRREASRV